MSSVGVNVAADERGVGPKILAPDFQAAAILDAYFEKAQMVAPFEAGKLLVIS